MEPTRNIIRYTLGQLSDLNHGKATDLKLFSSYPAPITSEVYQNPHNHRFDKSTPTMIREPVLKSTHIHSDQRVIEDIRKVISGITRENSKVELAISRMSELSIPDTQALGVAKLFHHSMIECDFLIDEYLRVLLNFKNTDSALVKNIYQQFTLALTGEFLKPSKFEDSHVETGKAKSIRWRIRNAMILAKLYNSKLPESPEFDYIRRTLKTNDIIARFLNPIFTAVSPTDNSTTQLLSSVWTIIRDGKKLEREAPEVFVRFTDQINAIINSSHYSATDKVRMMNLLEI